MKALISGLLLVAALPAMADTTANPRCEAKAADIEQQIQRAGAQGRGEQVAGLTTALDKVRSTCTDKQLLQELEGKASAAREEVRQREADLRDAELQGDPGKISKRQGKLDEARTELQHIEAQLDPRAAQPRQ